MDGGEKRTYSYTFNKMDELGERVRFKGSFFVLLLCYWTNVFSIYVVVLQNIFSVNSDFHFKM